MVSFLLALALIAALALPWNVFVAGGWPVALALLAGFAAAWILIGDSLGLERAARERVTEGVVVGARRGASPLGRGGTARDCAATQTRPPANATEMRPPVSRWT